MPSAGTERDLADALGALWTRRRDGFAARVTVIEAAVVRLLGGNLDDGPRAEATSEAHKLAGALGTFGVPGGSELARELEHALAADQVHAADAPRLAELVLALGREVERGPRRKAVPAGVARAELSGDADATAGAEPLTTPVTSDRLVPVLAVTGDPVLAQRLVDEGVAQGVPVTIAADARAAAAATERDEPCAVLVDLGEDDPDPALLGVLERAAHVVPAFALHAGDELAARVDLARLGVGGVLPRSLPPSAVIASIERTLARRTAAETRVAALDDDPSILDAVAALLAPDRVEVVGVGDADALWSLLRESAPDLIILDVDMPTVNGIDLCRVLRADARFEELPVLFLTARTDGETIERIFGAGADDYVAKPISEAELRGRVRNRISRARVLRELADRDGLTGVPNRRRASADLARLVLLADRYRLPLSIAIIDVDRFRSINTDHGHIAGDAVLRALGALLLQEFRGEDAIGRWGGEEFMVGLYGAGLEDAQRRMEEVLERFSALELPSPSGARVRATFSAGVAEHHVHANDVKGLYRAADEALLLAKANGRARVLPAGWTPPEGSQEVDVLVVEDDPALRDVLEHMLRTRGLSNLLFGDGRAAVEALEGPDPRVRPRVVLLDVDLPGLDGLSVLRRLRADGKLGQLRAIMLTAHAAEAEVLEALELGAVDHVAKPFSVPILMQRVEHAMQSA